MKKSLKQSKVRGMALALSLTMAAGSMPVFAAGGSGSTSSNTSGSTGTTTGGSTSSGSTSGSTNSGSTSTALTKALEEARKAVKELKTVVEKLKDDTVIKALDGFNDLKTALDTAATDTSTQAQILAVADSLAKVTTAAKKADMTTDSVTALKELRDVLKELSKLNEITLTRSEEIDNRTISSEETKITAALTNLKTQLAIDTKTNDAKTKATLAYPELSSTGRTQQEVSDTTAQKFRENVDNIAKLSKFDEVKTQLSKVKNDTDKIQALNNKLKAVLNLSQHSDLTTVFEALKNNSEQGFTLNETVKNFLNQFSKLSEVYTALNALVAAQNALIDLTGDQLTPANKKQKLEKVKEEYTKLKNLNIKQLTSTLKTSEAAVRALKTTLTQSQYTTFFQKLENTSLQLTGESSAKTIQARLTELESELAKITASSTAADYVLITESVKNAIESALSQATHMDTASEFQTKIGEVKALSTTVEESKVSEVTSKIKGLSDSLTKIKNVDLLSTFKTQTYITDLETSLNKAKAALEDQPKLAEFDTAAKNLVAQIKTTNGTLATLTSTLTAATDDAAVKKLLDDTASLNTKLNVTLGTDINTKYTEYKSKLDVLKGSTVTDPELKAAVTAQESNFATLNKAADTELKTKLDAAKTKVANYDDRESFKKNLTTTSTALTKLAEEAKEVTLTFNIEGTNVELKVTTQDFTTESTTLADIVKAKGDDKIKNPTKAGGYEFAEWKKTTTTGSSTSSVKYDLTTLTKAEFLKLTEGFTLTASFKSVRNITFNTGVTETTEKIKFEDADFSTTSATLSTILTSKGKTSLITPTRVGYEFTGWYTTDASGAKVAVDFTKINSAKFLELKENATFTAEWKAVRNVTFTNGEEGSSKKEVTLKLEETTFNGGKTLKDIVEDNTEIAKLNKDGYFISWFLTGQDKATDLSTITASTFTTLATTTSVFTAKYNLKTYKVTLSVNADKEQTKELTVTNGQILNSIYTVPTKANYTFAGWYTDASFSTKFDSSKAFNLDKDITLYAKWNKTDSSSSSNSGSSSGGSTGGGSASVSSSGGSSSNTSQGNKVNEENKTEVKEETTNQEETKVEETTNQKETNKTNNETKQPVVLTKEQLNLPKVNTEKVVSYSDTKNVSWAQESIEKLSKAGILNGNQDGTFSPNAASKRADVVIMFTKLLGLENQGVSGNNFTDVSKDKYYAKYLLVAKEFGLINGYSDGSFKPENTISRQDVMVLAVNVLKSLGFELNTNTSVLNKFSDANKISAYAKENVAILVNAGIISGSNGKINPTADITRAEMSVIVSRIYDLAAERVANLNLEQILGTEETANAEATTTEMTTTETKN